MGGYGPRSPSGARVMRRKVDPVRVHCLGKPGKLDSTCRRMNVRHDSR